MYIITYMNYKHNKKKPWYFYQSFFC